MSKFDDNNSRPDETPKVKPVDVTFVITDSPNRRRKHGFHHHLLGAVIGFLSILAVVGLIKVFHPDYLQKTTASVIPKNIPKPPAQEVPEKKEVQLPEKSELKKSEPKKPEPEESKPEKSKPEERQLKSDAGTPGSTNKRNLENPLGTKVTEAEKKKEEAVAEPPSNPRTNREQNSPEKPRDSPSLLPKNEIPPSSEPTDKQTDPAEDLNSDAKGMSDNPKSSVLPATKSVETKSQPAEFEIPLVFEFSLSGRHPQHRQQLLTQNGGDEKTEAAVGEALEWLAIHQLPDGGWSFAHATGPGSRSTLNPGEMSDARNAATGLALLAFLGAGNTHQEGKYKDVVRNGFTFLQKRAATDPKRGMSFSEPGSGTMYSHGICTAAFCEVYGMTRDRTLGAVARECVKLIENFQNPQVGGWRYEWQNPGDTSVTSWQVMSLETAQFAGIKVAPTTFQLTKNFLASISNGTEGFYGYREQLKEEANINSAATTAMGLLCQMALGEVRDRAGFRKGIQWLAELGPMVGNGESTQGVDMYYNYFATQVLKQVGGEPWKEWNGELRDYLLATAETEGAERGSWFFSSDRDQGAKPGGRLYHTALCCLILETYYRYEGKPETGNGDLANRPETVLPLQALPPAETTAAAREEVRQLFPELNRIFAKKSELKPEELEAAQTSSDRLWQLAKEESDAIRKFVLFEQAYFGSLYHERPERSREILAQWKSQFEIDELDFRKQACQIWATLINQVNENVEDRRVIRRELLKMIDPLIDDVQKAGRTEIGQELFDLSVTLAGQLGDEQLKKETKQRQEAFLKLAATQRAYSEAIDKLKIEPDDVEANSAAAKYEIEVNNDWVLGLQHLARISPSDLQVAIDLEAKDPKVAKLIGEAWAEAVALPSNVLSQRAIALRAQHWLLLAQEEASGLDKEKVLKRLKELEPFLKQSKQ